MRIFSFYFECNLGRRRNDWGEGGMLGEKEERLGRRRNDWGEGGTVGKKEECLGEGGMIGE